MGRKKTDGCASEGVNRNTLDAALMAAHETGDGAELARLYGKAGDAAGDVDEACFFWTHAYVFALEVGMSEASVYREKLAQYGREK